MGFVLFAALWLFVKPTSDITARVDNGRGMCALYGGKLAMLKNVEFKVMKGKNT